MRTDRLTPALVRKPFGLIVLMMCFLVGCQQRPKDLAEIVRDTKPSVVEVLAYNEGDTLVSTGTGFFISPNEIITNRHVIAFAKKAKIRLVSGSEYAVTYVTASNEFLDIIRLGVDVRNERIKGLTLSKEHPTEGERIVVVGNPLGLESTVSDGLISSVRSTNGRAGLIQISAPISPGSSGSPVLNMFGQVVGIATMQMREGQNLNFALPSQLIDSLQTGIVIPFTDWKAETLREKYKMGDGIRKRLASISDATEWLGKPGTTKDEWKLTKVMESHYDRAGNLTQEIQYKPNGNIEGKNESVYDEVGRKVERRQFDSSGTLIGRDSISYLDENHSEEFWWNESGQLAAHTDVFTQRPRSLRIDSIVEMDLLGKGMRIRTTRFDSLGNPVADSGFSNNRTTYSYYYNQRGWMIQETQREYNGDRLFLETTKIFDSFERVTHARPSSPYGAYTRELWFAYDNNGNPIMEMWFSMDDRGRYYTRKIRTFDDFGNLKTEDTYFRWDEHGESDFIFIDRRALSYKYYR